MCSTKTENMLTFYVKSYNWFNTSLVICHIGGSWTIMVSASFSPRQFRDKKKVKSFTAVMKTVEVKLKCLITVNFYFSNETMDVMFF